MSGDTPPLPRWPSAGSLAKVLAATGVGFAQFAAMVDPRSVPKLPWAAADRSGAGRRARIVDEAGFP